MRPELPSGSVTFLFTDVEGSTRLLHALGAEAYAAALAEHRRVIRDSCAAEHGVEVDTQGDAFFFAFPSAPRALAAARAFTGELSAGPIQVRVGLHTGSPLVTDEGYVGDDVHFAARLAACGHGGQVLVSSSTAALIEPSNSLLQALSELGEHRLKDIADAVPIFQLGDGAFPPLKTISNTNLPRPASSFLGREDELQEVLARVERGARLITLTGPGGTGKTRLALEAATSIVGDYKAGVFWVGLASLRDPALVTETIAQTLGSKNGLAEHIGNRELLLLLDNLEQVIDSAPELSELLQACPNLSLLVTSRELLRIEGEVEYPVPPLASEEAVSLFCERSQLAPSREIAELCVRLDNLPLAVELAAARAKALTPAQILERLSSRLDLLEGGRDADPRHQTLRATIDWSHELLSPEEQQLFARLSVFQGGCSLEAAEEVADADLDLLQSLVEKSLLRFTDSRYWMLETIREFARELLESSGNADVVFERLWQNLVALAESQGAPFFSHRQRAAFAVLAPEHSNVRAVVDWAVETDRRPRILELIGRLWVFWTESRHVREAAAWVESALGEPGRPPDEVWLPALIGAGEIVRYAGDSSRAIELKEALIELGAHYEPAKRWESAVLADLSDIARTQGELTAARRYAEGSMELALARGGSPTRGLSSLAEIALLEGDLDGAATFLRDAIQGWRDLGHDWNEAQAVASLGEVVRRQGDLASSSDLLVRAVRTFVALGDEASVGECLQDLASTANDAGRFVRAGKLWGAGRKLELAGGAVASQERRKPDVPADAIATGAAMGFEEAVAYALSDLD